MAKEILAETKTLYIPFPKIRHVAQAEAILRGALIQFDYEYKPVQFDVVEMERWKGKYRPDLKCVRGDNTLFVEIIVSHQLDEEKIFKVKDDNVSMIEIDLSNVGREITREELAEFLASPKTPVRWVNMAKNPPEYDEVLKQRKELRQFVSQSQKVLLATTSNEVIFDCPIKTRLDRPFVYSDRCPACRYCAGIVRNQYETKVWCIGDNAWEYNKLLGL
ncbi:MAG: hypothetical protein EOO08_12135 [Chitinophagaceae bacterium]|nr:MAG: hypothetical protein EOO08_12135 [Chitinophagaceae bacterium]